MRVILCKELAGYFHANKQREATWQSKELIEEKNLQKVSVYQRKTFLRFVA